MTQFFAPGLARRGFDGEVVWQTDPSSGSGVAYAFANDTAGIITDDNRDYPDAVDNSGLTHISIPGMIDAVISASGCIHPDRAFHTFLNSAFGVRTGGQLVPWVQSFIPYGGAAQVKSAGIWWNQIVIASAYAKRGAAQRLSYGLAGVCADPKNASAVTDLTIPSVAGSNGAGAASFIQCSFTDGQVSPVTYDNIRAFKLTLNNGLLPQPASKNRTARIGNGFTPGTLKGTLSVIQNKGATQAIPRTAGIYPFQINIPTGDGTHTLTIDLSLSYDSDGQSVAANDFSPDAISYNVFGTAAGATTTAGWNMIASYA